MFNYTEEEKQSVLETLKKLVDKMESGENGSFLFIGIDEERGGVSTAVMIQPEYFEPLMLSFLSTAEAIEAQMLGPDDMDEVTWQ